MKSRRQLLARVMGGDFPQPGKSAGGIGYGAFLRVGPCCGRWDRDALNDRGPMASRLGSNLYLLNFAYSSLIHLLQILCGGHVGADKFMDHDKKPTLLWVCKLSATVRWLPL